MHKDFDINVCELSKIEGHGSLEISVRDKKVTDARLRIFENRRFMDMALIGKKYYAAPQLCSRICGTCSAAHLMASLGCIEDAIGLEPSEQTRVLRDLTLYGVNIRDHAMHLFLFVLPGLFGKDSVLEFPEGYEHDLLHKAFAIKRAGNTLSTEVAGRTVHPPFPNVGSFLHVPTKDKAKALIPQLKEVREHAIEFIHLFAEKDNSFELPDTEFIANINSRYSYLGGGICMHSDGICIPRDGFERFFKERVVPYSQDTGFSFQGRPYMVGALSRMNLNLVSLHKETRESIDEDSFFPSTDLYHNNLAQAIEILHCIDSSIELLERSDFKQEPVPEKPKHGDCEGVGVLEAPRGTLFYHMKIDKDDIIRHANLIIPTAQNHTLMEKAVAKQVEDGIASGKKKAQMQDDVEALVRAFDPCMSCATHFLEFKWL